MAIAVRAIVNRIPLQRYQLCTDISSVSCRLEASLKWLGAALMVSCLTFMKTGNTDVASMTAEDSGEVPLKAGDSRVVFVKARTSGVVDLLAEGSCVADMMG